MRTLRPIGLAKAGAVGALAALAMFAVLAATIRTGVAPFNTPPSGAFLAAVLGIQAPPLALAGHFAYGILWSAVLVTVFRERTDVARGLGLAMVLWLVMMVVYSPLIGWGFFGFGAVDRPETHPLHLGSPVRYVVASSALHLLYGFVIGWLNPRWIRFGAPEPERSAHAGAARTVHSH